MTKKESVESFFDGLAKRLDTVYDTAQGVLDEAFIVVDEFFDQWRKNAIKLAEQADGNENGEPVKVEPDTKTKLEDIIRYRKSQNRQHSLFEGLLNNLATRDPESRESIYADGIWDELPEAFKSWTQRDKNSPL